MLHEIIKPWNYFEDFNSIEDLMKEAEKNPDKIRETLKLFEDKEGGEKILERR